MYNIALSLPLGACLDYGGQSVILSNLWVAMLVASLVLTSASAALGQKKFSVIFAVFFAVLLLIRIVHRPDECKQGGLFEPVTINYVVLGVIAVLLAGLFIYSCINYSRIRFRKTKK